MIITPEHPINCVQSFDDLLRLPYFDLLACLSEGPLHPGGSAATKLLIESAGLERHESVLEVGCGPGWTTRALLRNGVDVLATDASAAMAKACRYHCIKQGISPPPFIVGEFEVISRSIKKKFDLILFECVFGFFRDPESIVANCRNLLTTRGRVGILDLHYTSEPPPDVLAELNHVVAQRINGRDEEGWLRLMNGYQNVVWDAFELSHKYYDTVEVMVNHPLITEKFGDPNNEGMSKLRQRLQRQADSFAANKQFMRGHIGIWSIYPESSQS